MTDPTDRKTLIARAHRLADLLHAELNRDTDVQSCLRELADALELAAPAPIPMVLHCPACGLQHIDRPEVGLGILEGTEDWSNPPHRSHLCHGCGHIWRPADVSTTGVASIETRGKADSPLAAHAPEGEPNPWNEINAEKALARWVLQDHEAHGLHERTAKLVRTFAHALAQKLRAAEKKHGYSDGWAERDWEVECQSKLAEHIAKGDPLDVAANAAFCWHNQWSTAAPAPVLDREADEKAMGYLIDERDAAEQALSQAYYLVVGSSPEWSNLFGHAGALEEIDDTQHILRESLKAALARPSAAPEGWVLAPKEPDAAMRDAGMKAQYRPGSSGDVYRAMIAAAPSPPLAGKEAP